MARRLRNMTAAQSAARMTRLLASKPRSASAKRLVASLPKPETKRVVTAEEYNMGQKLIVRRPDGSIWQGGALITKQMAREWGLQRERDAQRHAMWVAMGKRPSPDAPATTKRRDKLRPARREEGLMHDLLKAQAGLCFLCGDHLTADAIEPDDPMRASFDHVVPRCRGGRNTGNRLAAHQVCNGRKADRLPYACERLFLSVVTIIVDTPR